MENLFTFFCWHVVGSKKFFELYNLTISHIFDMTLTLKYAMLHSSKVHVTMVQVSRHLFRWTKEVVYADYYERALTNGVLSIQRGTQPGVMIYMLPLGRGVSKSKSYHGWGTPFSSFWCCYGTGKSCVPFLQFSVFDFSI